MKDILGIKDDQRSTVWPDVDMTPIRGFPTVIRCLGIRMKAETSTSSSTTTSS